MALGTKVGGASSPRLGSRREHRQSFHLFGKMAKNGLLGSTPIEYAHQIGKSTGGTF